MLHVQETQSNQAVTASLNRLLTLAEAAPQLRITLNTARNWLYQGKFPVPVRKLNGMLVCRQSDIYSYIDGLFSEPLNPQKTLADPAAAPVKRGRGRPKKLPNFTPLTQKEGGVK